MSVRSPVPASPNPLPWRVAVVLYMGIIVSLSHTASPPVPQELALLGDKALHTLEYAGLGFLWAAAVRGPARRRFSLAWLGATLFGLTDEFHQAFVPGRDASWADALADAVGAAAGAALASAWFTRRKKVATGPQVPPGSVR